MTREMNINFVSRQLIQTANACTQHPRLVTCIMQAHIKHQPNCFQITSAVHFCTAVFNITLNFIISKSFGRSCFCSTAISLVN